MLRKIFICCLFISIVMIGCSEQPSDPEELQSDDETISGIMKGKDISSVENLRSSIELVGGDPSVCDCLQVPSKAIRNVVSTSFNGICNGIVETKSVHFDLTDYLTNKGEPDLRDPDYLNKLFIGNTTVSGNVLYANYGDISITDNINDSEFSDVFRNLESEENPQIEYWDNLDKLSDQQFMDYYKSKGYNVVSKGSGIFEIEKTVGQSLDGSVIWQSTYSRITKEYTQNRFINGGDEIFTSDRSKGSNGETTLTSISKLPMEIEGSTRLWEYKSEIIVE